MPRAPVHRSAPHPDHVPGALLGYQAASSPPARRQSTIVQHAGLVPRSVFEHVNVIVPTGHVLYERGLDDEFDDYPLIKKMEVDEREVYLKLYNNIVRHIPGLREFMDANPPKVALESAMQKVDPPVQNTRSDHSSNLRSRILDYVPLPPQKSFGRDASRVTRVIGGFRTRWGAGNIIISELDLPLFLWKNYEYSSKDPYNGFLQSKVLKKAWMCIYFGPGAVDGAAQAVSNERGIAKKHHMTEVTPHSIAYTAVLVRNSSLCIPCPPRIDGRARHAVTSSRMSTPGSRT
ncbi:hypothetical protein BC834DRAFT_847646 [Gloeopeniophorella convolvens]|nr:hypothetical protein BC834DRAFT_847646 [Gloeopeniophorella convolvens]